MATRRIEIGESVILTGLAYRRAEKFERKVAAVEIDPPITMCNGERTDPFIRVAIEGEDGWFTAEGDKIPVGIGRPRFVRRVQAKAA